MRKKPTRAHEIFDLPNGGKLFMDRRVVPIRMKCDHCGKVTSNWAPDEDGTNWCLDCIEKWELKHKQHWANGKPK